MSSPFSPAADPIVLRVIEALPKDVGRGLARIDPQDLARLQLQIGDVVAIKGKRTTLARITPTHADQRGHGVVQIDGVVRANAGVALDERVTLAPATVQPARAATVAPTAPMRGLSSPSHARYLARLLSGLPVIAGDQLRANLFGARPQTFTVIETAPPGPVLIGHSTSIRLAETPSERAPAGISYEDVGGLRRELRRIREIIELPLRYPEVFERLGIAPPKGVLLHGPPGTGKTLIARAVAHESSAHFIGLNGPEIMDKLYGASEANLRGYFEEARRHAPAIIFIDEIDAIAPKREDMSGDRQVERRVVAQLLSLMDGLESRGDVVVIAATNLPDALDPALRRPGRFDREIAIGVPDQQGRREILEIHGRGMPLAPDVDLNKLAVRTHGFVGADLEALAREAAMGALRRLLPDLDFGRAQLPYEQLAALEVTADDLHAALATIEPSAMREFAIEVPNVAWEAVGGLEAVKQLLTEVVEWPLSHRQLFAQAGVRPASGVLLYGPPGTGKTLLARALASRSEANFIAVQGPQLLSMWVGESERAVREVFRKARQSAPCIIFFDEFDALAPARGSDQVSERVVGQLLTELAGIADRGDVVVLAATNRLDRIDPALLRPGRFDFLVEVPPPDEAGRLAILRQHTRAMPLAPEVNLHAVALATAARTGAELEGLCRRAALLALGDHIRAAVGVAEEASHDDTSSPIRVSNRHFEAALDELLDLRHHSER